MFLRWRNHLSKNLAAEISTSANEVAFLHEIARNAPFPLAGARGTLNRHNRDGAMDWDFWISTEAWQRDLLAIKRAILDCEPSEAMRLIDELIERLELGQDETEIKPSPT